MVDICTFHGSPVVEVLPLHTKNVYESSRNNSFNIVGTKMVVEEILFVGLLQ